MRGGGHAYHATMPTDAIVGFRDAMLETKAMGFRGRQGRAMGAGPGGAGDAGREGRAVGRGRGLSGAGGGGQLHRRSAMCRTARSSAAEGLQIAAGVPLQVGEGPEFRPSGWASSGWTS